MKRNITLVGFIIFLVINAGTMVSFGGSFAGSRLKRQEAPLRQEPAGTVTRVIAPAPTDISSLAMSSMDFHGAIMRGNNEQISVLMAEDFTATMPDGKVLDRTQLLDFVVDTRLFYRATVAPANVRGNTATTFGSIIPMRGRRELRTKFGFTDTWEKHGHVWLLTATVIRRWKTYPRRHR